MFSVREPRQQQRHEDALLDGCEVLEDRVVPQHLEVHHREAWQWLWLAMTSLVTPYRWPCCTVVTTDALSGR